MQRYSIFLSVSMALLDQGTLTCSVTRFTRDIPKTFTKHNMFPTCVPLKAVEKSHMQVSARSGSETVKILSKAWADLISVSCLAFFCPGSVLYRVLYIRKAAIVKQKSFISVFPHWWLVRLRQDCREDNDILEALREAEKLFQIANTEKCVQGRVFPFTGHDLHLM